MNCRSCRNNQISSILSLGNMPLVNGLLKEEQLSADEPLFPLDIVLCEGCSLVQLKDTVNPKDMFADYFYFSSNSDTMLASAKELVEKIIPSLPKDAHIIEIGSNDGYLLQNYKHHPFNILGIEPAANIASYANLNGIPTLNDFFSLNLSKKLKKEKGQVDIIHANNVMAHIPNINDFAAAIKQILKPQGRAIIEVPYLVKLIENCEFDTIYHEHVYYFSLSALEDLFQRHGLSIFEVEVLPIHGYSLRLFVANKNAFDISANVTCLKQEEKLSKVHSFEFFSQFEANILKLKFELMRKLNELKNQNKKIAAYGASAKGAILLNYFNIGEELIDFVVDKSPYKQGYYTPGTRLKILPVTALNELEVDYTLLLAWNFADEILHQQKTYRERGGKFIIPIPNLQIV